MNNKKKLLITISIICIFLTLIGVSFAYYIANFNIVNKDNSDSTVTTTSLVEAILEIPNKDDNTNIYPGYKTSKEYIVKGKGNSTSKVIEASLIVKPNLEDFSKYVYWSLYKSDEEITCSNSLDNDSIGISLKSECNIPESAKLVLSGNGDITHINLTINYDTNDKYYLVTEYLNSDEDQSDLMDKEFNIDISLEPLEDSIQNKIIAQLDTIGKCPAVNDDGTINVTAGESENSLLCSAPDNYGTSYYYRGNVQNNYVYFAGFYWRIVRINGDGSIRMIYDGTTAHENGEASADRIIGVSAYNTYWKRDNLTETSNSYVYYDNAGLGYMYGNRDGIVEQSTQYQTIQYLNTSTYYIAKEYNYDAILDRFTLKNPIQVSGSQITKEYIGYYTFNKDTNSDSFQYIYKIDSVNQSDSFSTIGYRLVTYGTTSIAKAQTNTNDSTIKTYIDKWYEQNKNNIEKYLVDNLFCNSRTVSSYLPDGYTNKAYGAEKTYYVGKVTDNKTKISEKCSKNDAFTINNQNGNGKLKFAIGLLSLDDILLASNENLNVKMNYLNIGAYYWSMTPVSFDGNNLGIAVMSTDGTVSTWHNSLNNFGVKPVINLKSDSLKFGDCTINNPYTVE